MRCAETQRESSGVFVADSDEVRSKPFTASRRVQIIGSTVILKLRRLIGMQGSILGHAQYFAVRVVECLSLCGSLVVRVCLRPCSPSLSGDLWGDRIEIELTHFFASVLS